MSENTADEYELGQDNVRFLGLDLHNPVFFISGVVIVGFVIISLMFQEGTAEALGAIALLLGGGLGALQAASISTGLPFAIVLVLMCVSTWKGLRGEEI